MPAPWSGSLPLSACGEGAGGEVSRSPAGNGDSSWLATPSQWTELEEAARRMRREPTASESSLWQELRPLRSVAPFRRQHVLGSYVVDFYSHSAQLVIEVDRPYHMKTAEQDRDRTAYLEAVGPRVLRFTNDEVKTEIESVPSRIRKAINTKESPHE